MKTHYKITALVLSIVSAAMIFASCKKGNNASGHDYLRLSHAVVHVTEISTQTKFSVESDLRWNLKFSPANVAWAHINKSNGKGNTIVTIIATQPPLPNGAVRSVDIIASADDNPAILPVRLTLLQHDTTYIK